MINQIFNQTAIILLKISKKLHLTYNEINVIVYYGFIPLTWMILLDFILNIWPILTLIWSVICLSIYLLNRKNFSQWCDLIFQKSVDFLLSFNCINWDYYKASVYICVILVLIIYLILLTLLIAI